MVINKKALARAIVPYVYEEAENQGLTTNSGSERLSIEGEIEDPSGQSDGLYVEAYVKCSCDRDFPMDRNTGWRDTADAKSLSYKVLDATVYTDDDQDIDVTEELQNALSWPNTYGPKKNLKEDFKGEIDPEDPATANVADAIASDVFDQGNIEKGKVYSGTIKGNFGDELDGMYTVKYRVKVTQVGKSAFRSSFTPYIITMSNDEVGNVDMTDAIAEYWSIYDSARKAAGDYDGYDEDLDPDDPIIENGANAIGEDIFEKNGKVVAGKVYSGKITGTFGAEFDTGEDDEFTITYKVKVIKVGKDAWNSHFTPIKVTVTGEGLNVNMTKAVAEYWSGVNAMHSDGSLDEEDIF